MGLEEKAEHAIERMFEFYEQKELIQFITYCNRNELPYYESVIFLDGQTRFDYFVLQEPPNIYDYMLRTSEYFNREE